MALLRDTPSPSWQSFIDTLDRDADDNRDAADRPQIGPESRPESDAEEWEWSDV